jgi:hypothetical protein
MNRISGALILFLAFFLLHYVVFRANHLSFTHDESLSYLVVEHFYVHVDTTRHLDTKTISEVEADYFTYLLSPNTHIINSAWMLLVNRFGGNQAFLYRLLSILSFIVYVIYAYKIACIRENKQVTLPLFIMLTTTTYFLDFFSLARGYGISMTLMLMSIYHLTRGVGSHFTLASANQLVWAFLFAMLSAVSNLMWLHYLLAVALVLIPVLVQTNGTADGKLSTGMLQFRYRLLLICIAGIVILLPYVLVLQQFGQFYYGSDQFFRGTLQSLSERWLYAESLIKHSGAALYIGLTVLLCMVMAAVFRLRSEHQTSSIPLLLLLLVVLMTYVQHVVFGIPLPDGRTGLPIMMLFMLSMVWLLMEYQLVAWVAALFQLILFVLSFNYTHTFDWKYDADTKEAFNTISTDHAGAKPACMYTNWYYVPTFNYYQSTQEESGVQKILYTSKQPADYAYLNSGDTVQADAATYQKWKAFPVSGSVLYKHR